MGVSAFYATLGESRSVENSVKPRRMAHGGFPLRKSRISTALARQFHRHGFPFGVVLDRGFAVFSALARLFEAAERGARVDDVVAVDPDRARLYFAGEEVGLVDVLRPDRGGEAVVGVIRPRDHFVDVLEGQHAHDGAKDFVFRDRHVVADVIEDRGLDEEAAVAVLHAAGDEFRALLLPELAVLEDFVLLLLARPAGLARLRRRAGRRVCGSWLCPRGARRTLCEFSLARRGGCRRCSIGRR